MGGLLMAAIDYLTDQGLTVQVVGDRLMVAPSGKLTPDLRQWIKEHRIELMDEARLYRCWRIYRGGKPIGTMVGAPITYATALGHARFRWGDAEVYPVRESHSE